MSFVISPGFNAPGGYVVPVGHTVAPLGHEAFFHRLRRWITGNPEIDLPTVAKVGTHDTELLQIDTHDNVAEVTGTYELRMNASLVDMTLSHTVAGVLDTLVPAPAATLTDYNFDRSQSHGVAFRIDRTVDADPAILAEGWDWDLGASGLAAADRWFAETYSRSGGIMRGRRISGGSDVNDRFYMNLEFHATASSVRIRAGENAAMTGNTSGYRYTPLTSGGTIEYAISASHRHFCWVARVASRYHQQWGGFIDTFATSAQYPYPLAICCDSRIAGTLASDDSDEHTAFMMNADDASRYRTVEGIWSEIGGQSVVDASGVESGDLGIGPNATEAGFYPYHPGPDENTEDQEYNGTARPIGMQGFLGGAGALYRMRGPVTGERYVIPVMIIQGESDRHLPLGELASVFCTNGQDQGGGPPLEEIFTISGDDYVMIPNISRVQEQNWWALKLE